MHIDTAERHEIIYELSQLFTVVQERGSRLAGQTNGRSYSLVRELNELLHQARVQMELIEAEVTGSPHYRPTHRTVWNNSPGVQGNKIR